MKKVFVDQMGREVAITASPKRIISLVPSQTELLYAFQLENEVVGITKFCIHPKEWFESKKRIGGTKQLKLDVIRELQPDLIIGNKEENTKEDIAFLEKEFPVWMSDVNTIEDAFEMILSVGEICNRQQESQVFVQNIRNSFQGLNAIGKGKKVLYFIWHEPAFVVGKNTFIDAMIQLLGFENACSLERYPSLEELKNCQPDFVFLSSEPFPFSACHQSFYSQLFPEAKVLFVDGEMFSWYGSRMELAANYFKKTFSNFN